MELDRVALVSSGPGRHRLEGLVRYGDGFAETVWFDLPTWVPTCGPEVGDPWIVALAPLAMTLGEPLRVSLPVDAILGQGVEFAARAWKAWFPHLSALTLDVPRVTRPAAPELRRVGSLFSGGADSWHTLLRNAAEAEAGRARRIDTLLVAHGADVLVGEVEVFQRVVRGIEPVARARNLDLLAVGSNLRDTRFGDTNWRDLSHGSFFISLIHAAACFERCSIPSSVMYRTMRPWGSHPLTDPLLSSEWTRILYDSAEMDRNAKLREIAQHPEVLNGLRVCWRSGSERNCGRCEKCLRTMVTLELAGALEHCSAFPERRVDLALLRRLMPKNRDGFRRVRRLYEEAVLAGRPEMARALEAGFRRGERLQVARWVLSRVGGGPGASLLNWLERDSIPV